MVSALAIALVVAIVACSGVSSNNAVTEPIRVRNATFKSGGFPGGGPAPTVTLIETASTVIRPGELSKSISGRVSPDAFAVGIRLADLGTGYWVFPASGPDFQNNNELVWQSDSDFGVDVPTGTHILDVVAIDGNGNAGPVRELSLCFAPAVPDNLNACNPATLPPASVFSLSWDTPVDLDLVVVTPDGRIVSAKHPRTVAPPLPGPGAQDAGVTANTGVFDRDSNANCVIDGIQREDLVFQATPASGSYLVYASLFDACGHANVHFKFSLFESSADDPAQPNIQHLTESITKEGFMLPLEASGGATLGTFVTEVPY